MPGEGIIEIPGLPIMLQGGTLSVKVEPSKFKQASLTGIVIEP